MELTLALAPSAREFAPPEVKSRLSAVLQRVGEASAAGEYAAAFRWADRAERIAPNSEIVNEIIGRLLARLGEHDKALLRLRRAFAARPHPSLQVAAIDVLFAMGRIRQGFATLESALGRFAVEPGDDLGLCARRHTLAKDGPAPGWVALAPDLHAIGELRANVPGGLRLLSSEFRTLSPVLSPLLVDDFPGWSFRAALPKGYHGELGAAAGTAVLIGSDASFPPDFRVDGRSSVDDGMLSGWVSLGWAPEIAPEIVLTADGQGPVTVASARSVAEDGRHAFEVNLKDLGLEAMAVEVAVLSPIGETELLADSPAWVELPKAPLGVGRGPSPRGPNPRSVDEKVDVIVPVYKGLEETLTCLRSVLNHFEDVADLIVIDDASPDRELSAELRIMAAGGEITLLTNAANLGFAASVNWGLGIHPDRDSVMLNSDAEVFQGWIGRLRRAAYSAPDIGTVTPLTNSGTLASYPDDEGSPCTSEGGAHICDIASRANDGITVETPTGVGFCLYIRQDCRAATGLLDNDCYGRGYGEQNDFCMRARRLGWRHVIAPDVYVRHLEGQSFGPLRRALMERNAKLLERRHPGYDALVEDFIRLDPLHSSRRRLDEHRLLEAGGPYVLLVSLALGGGVDRYVQARRDDLRKQGLTPLVVKPSDDRVSISLTTDNDTLKSLHYRPEERSDLEALLGRLSMAHVEVHHFLGLPSPFLEFVFEADWTVDVFIHDYCWVCPRINFLGGNGSYCGEPDLAACDRCINTHGGDLEAGLLAGELRLRSARWLTKARLVVAPTQDVQTRLSRYFPDLPVQVRPWEDVPFDPAPPGDVTDKPLKVAVIGAIGDHKGYKVIEACAKDAAKRGAKISFVIVGFSQDDAPLEAAGDVFITGRFEESEVDELIKREAPDVAFLPSLWPETWCYALSHALRARLPIIAFDIGAIAERSRAAQTRTILLPLESSATEINGALLTAGLRYQEPSADPVVLDQSSQRSELEVRAAVQSPLSEIDTNLASAVDERPMSDAPIKAKANVQILTLAQGLYQFSVKSAGAGRKNNRNDIALPAVQIAAAPGIAHDSVEYMTGLRTEGAWLFDLSHMLIVKIKIDGVPIFITSYSAEGLAPLKIEVERVDAAQAAPETEARQRRLPVTAAQPQPAQLAGGPGAQALIGSSNRRAEDGRRILPARIIAHISRRGDVAFVDQPWAGVLDAPLAIEGFWIEPLMGLSANDIEYKSLSEKGVESPWIRGGGFCGTRQLNLALSGFSVRIVGQKAKNFECVYRGLFTSGVTLGPMRNGAPLHAGALGDHLQAIELLIVEVSREPVKSAAPAPEPNHPEPENAVTAPNLGPLGASALASAPVSVPVQAPAPAPVPRSPDPRARTGEDPTSQRPKRVVGPRFSVFREEEG